jgi:3-oxoacyl-[acyl-carrier protein] reductase
MTVPKDIVNLVRETVNGLGKLDILVNNAVNSTSDRASQIPDDVILNHITTKIMGYIRCARECVPHITASGGGRIINIGGMAARNSSPTNPGSGVTNSAMSNYSKALSDDVADDGILVNCIHPGSTRTERYMGLVAERANRNNTSSEAELAGSVGEIPIGRMIEPDDIANLAAFLCSDLASAITGQTIAVDGGAGRGVHF